MLYVCYLEFGKFSNNLHYVDYDRLPIEEFSEKGGSIPHNRVYETDGGMVRSGGSLMLGQIVAVHCLLARVDLEERAKAKERLQTAGKEISDDTIEDEIKLMREEKKKQEELASSQSSPLFQPVLLFMQEKQKWIGTSKQFKEAICFQSPDTFTWKAPSKFVNELEKSTLALQEEGIVVTVPPETTLITLTRVAMKESPEMG